MKYNLTPKKEKKAAYREMISPEVLDTLYDKVLQTIIVEKKYLDPKYTARRLADDLQTNTRYISAVVAVRFGMNYTSLVNFHRVRDALYLLTDRRFVKKRIGEIAEMVGFANRQSFYAAFYKLKGLTPKQYRQEYLEKRK